MTFHEVATKIIPVILIILDLLGALVYAFYKDWGRVTYWACAGILTYSVTFLIKTKG